MMRAPEGWRRPSLVVGGFGGITGSGLPRALTNGVAGAAGAGMTIFGLQVPLTDAPHAGEVPNTDATLQGKHLARWELQLALLVVGFT